MKKSICLVLAVLMLMLTACSKENAGTADMLEIPENESTASETESEPEEQPEEKDAEFFPAAGAYLDYGTEYIRGRAEWNDDNTLTFQNENTLVTISAENEIIETVSLPKENLPEDGGYDLYWNEKYILAIDVQAESSQDQYGAAVFDDEGKVFLANVFLFDRKGNFVKEYNRGAFGGYDENGKYKFFLSDSESFGELNHSYLADGNRTYWIDEDKVIFECHLWVIYYDFSKGEGKVLDNMGEYLTRYGKFSGYYGVEYGQCGVLNGDFYYLAHKNDEKGNSAGTIWKANENGAKELFDGKEFYHFFVGKEILIAVEGIDGDYYKNGSAVYAIYPENPELKAIFGGWVGLPFGDDGQIRFRNDYNETPRILYSYDYKNGERTEDVGNTEFDVQSIAPGYSGYVMKSPDGKYFAEYDSESEEPRLRIMPCE